MSEYCERCVHTDAEIARLRAELERKDAALREFDWALGQLRHLYVQANLAEGLKNGLLGPQIERLEKVRAALNNLPERNDGE